MKEALKLGLIYGAISILISLVSTALSDGFMFTGTSVAIGFIYPMIILVFGGRFLFRRIEDIDLSYGVAVKYLLISCVIGMSIGMLFSIVKFANDDDLKAVYFEMQVNVGEKAARFGASMSGADEARIEEAVEMFHEKIESGEIDFEEAYPFQMSKLPVSFGSVLLMSLIYSLIAGIFVRVKDAL